MRVARRLRLKDERIVVARRTIPSLGEILVGRHLITYDQLHGALAEQETTRRRLGAMLVSQGTISKAELTDALAEQVSAIMQPSELVGRGGIRGSIARVARVRPAIRVPAGMRHPPELTADLDRQVRSAAKRRSGAATEQRRARETGTAELLDLQAELNHARQVVAAQGAQIARLLAHVLEIEEGVSEPVSEPPPSPGGNGTFLLLKPRRSDGYELVERRGEPPRVGQVFEIDDRRFSVIRVGASPLPSDIRACAYLQAE